MRYNLDGFGAPYNISSYTVPKLIGAIKITAQGVTAKTKIRLPLGTAAVKLKCGINLHTIVPITGSPATISLTANQPAVKTKQRLRLPATSIVILAIPAKMRQKIYLTANARDMLVYSTVNLPTDVYEYTYLDLCGLMLSPGETLVIDSENITVTADGRNRIWFWEPGSKPILLGNGENTLIYEFASEDGELACDIVWRDRWI